MVTYEECVRKTASWNIDFEKDDNIRKEAVHTRCHSSLSTHEMSQLAKYTRDVTARYVHTRCHISLSTHEMSRLAKYTRDVTARWLHTRCHSSLTGHIRGWSYQVLNLDIFLHLWQQTDRIISNVTRASGSRRKEYIGRSGSKWKDFESRNAP